MLSAAPVMLAPSVTWAQPTPNQSLLLEAHSQTDLRARLLARVKAISETDPEAAAEGAQIAGWSFWSEGKKDSALTPFALAVRLKGTRTQRRDYAEALLVRDGPGDADNACAVLRPEYFPAAALDSDDYAEISGWLGWAHFLAGRADSAAVCFASGEGRLTEKSFEWRYRIAQLSLARGELARTIRLLGPAVIGTRLQDDDITELWRETLSKTSATAAMESMLAKELYDRDQDETNLEVEYGVRRLRYHGAGGFGLSTIASRPAGKARVRAAVALMAPGDTLPHYDSLYVGLRDAGLAVALASVRGSGHSAGRTCPSREAWRGRDVALQTLCARDVPATLTALATVGAVDTTRYLLIGFGASAPIAIEAASRDPRVAALLLVSPLVSPVEVGASCARLAARKVPTYFLISPEDGSIPVFVDGLYHACDMRKSRIADCEFGGVAATMFHRDPKNLIRFLRWLRETLPPAAPRARPRAR